MSSDAWDVLLLFSIPVGGGIPAGVVLAKSRGLGLAATALLYFVSDLLLACVFEPLMLLFLRWSRRSRRASAILEAFGKSMSRNVARYGIHPSPFHLVMVTFGTDPMTGRAVAKAAGHGFVTGWAVTITGDMLFFGVVMASTLWLNDAFGNGALAALVVTAFVLLTPSLVRKAISVFRR